MKQHELVDLYTEYLLCQNSQASATMCSSMLENIVKHDSFSRMLKVGVYGSKYVWHKSKGILNNCGKGLKILSIDNYSGTVFSDR